MTAQAGQSRFNEYVVRVLDNEGGYVNNPMDPGGATNYGITQRIARAHGFTGDMRNFPQSKAIEIYRSDYWNAIRGDDLPQSLAWQVFDYSVNSGPVRAIKTLQSVVGVTADGALGPKTIAAVNASNEAAAIMKYLSARLAFNADLGTWPTFGRGWARRAASNLEYGAEDFSSTLGASA